MIKNGIYRGVAESYGTDGEGIIRVEGTTAFVPFCLVGEEALFRLLKQKGNIAYGRLEKVLTPSPHRVTPRCPVFGKCGGCDLQHADYPTQLDFKRASVEAALKKIGGIPARVEPCVPCAREYGYRNKLVLPIGVDGNGAAQAGFFARRSHRIVPTEGCAIQADWADAVFSAVGSFLKNADAANLRHLAVREVKGKFIFALVARRAVDATPLIKEIEKSFKEFTFLLNVNASESNVIFGNDWRVLRGDGFFRAEENGIKYRAGANTFLQVNDDVRAKLYARALAAAEPDCAAVDLYSGGGMLTAMLAKKCGAAYGIEVVKEASLCAEELKTANGLQNKMFNICGTVEENLDKVLSLTAGRKRVIVCDPPRKGMERGVVNAVARSGADKIVLISCNAATLARDLGLLLGTLKEENGALVKTGGADGGYEIASVTPFDMFPQTKWCETLVVLSKKLPPVISTST